MGRKKFSDEQEAMLKELVAAKKRRDTLEAKFLASVNDLDALMLNAHVECGLSITAIHEAVEMTRATVYRGMRRFEDVT